jgi:hypothetical protein
MTVRMEKTFLPQATTVDLVCESRKDPISVAPQLHFTSQRHAPLEAERREIVQEAIGERVIDVLGTLARRYATREPRRRYLVVVTPSLTFIPDVARELVQDLGLADDRDTSAKAITGLAEDLRTWAASEPRVSDYFGIYVDEATNEVRVRCPDLRPQVGPLTP